MASLAVTPSATQYSATQRVVAQARRTAEQAQQTASTQQAQARDAWATVKRAESEARATDARSSQATAKAEQAQRQLATLGNRDQSQPVSLKQVDAAPKYAPEYAAARSNNPSLINKQPQRLGVLVNAVA
jgi:membrane protein involved in colicin uptake